MAQNIFQIDSNTGQIKLSRSILTESVKSYKVSTSNIHSNEQARKDRTGVPILDQSYQNVKRKSFEKMKCFSVKV